MKHPIMLTMNPAIPHWDRRRVDDIPAHFLLTITFLKAPHIAHPIQNFFGWEG